MSKDLQREIIESLPHLRAVALLLCRDRSLADDLVQEAVVRALGHIHQFRSGTNLKAWIMTILRNAFFSEMRRRKRASQFNGEMLWNGGATSGGQEERLMMRDLERAFRMLPSSQREAIILVGASGYSYEDAAQIADCAVGTMKSRVSRARLQLELLLDGAGAPAAMPIAAAARMRIEERARAS